MSEVRQVVPWTNVGSPAAARSLRMAERNRSGTSGDLPAPMSTSVTGPTRARRGPMLVWLKTVTCAPAAA